MLCGVPFRRGCGMRGRSHFRRLFSGFPRFVSLVLAFRSRYSGVKSRESGERSGPVNWSLADGFLPIVAWRAAVRRARFVGISWGFRRFLDFFPPVQQARFVVFLARGGSEMAFSRGC
jgi:hypothetical protein